MMQRKNETREEYLGRRREFSQRPEEKEKARARAAGIAPDTPA